MEDVGEANNSRPLNLFLENEDENDGNDENEDENDGNDESAKPNLFPDLKADVFIQIIKNLPYNLINTFNSEDELDTFIRTEFPLVKIHKSCKKGFNIQENFN